MLSSLFPLPQWTIPVKIAPSSPALSSSWTISIPTRQMSCIPLNFPVTFQLSHDTENIFVAYTYFFCFLFLLLVILISLWRKESSDSAFTTSPWIENCALRISFIPVFINLRADSGQMLFGEAEYSTAKIERVLPSGSLLSMLWVYID